MDLVLSSDGVVDIKSLSSKETLADECGLSDADGYEVVRNAVTAPVAAVARRPVRAIRFVRH